MFCKIIIIHWNHTQSACNWHILTLLHWKYPSLSVYYEEITKGPLCKPFSQGCLGQLWVTSVCHHVTFKIVIHCKSLVTLAALICPLPRVCPRMIFKSIIYYESLVTLAALIWFFPRVCPHVICKTPFPWERLVTLGALIWFLPSVFLHVFFKMPILGESLVTLSTLIWFLPSVCHHVYCKIPFLYKRLLTLGTLIWLLPSMFFFMCSLRCPFWEKDLSHWVQWYGFSPVCVILCVIRWLFRENEKS